MKYLLLPVLFFLLALAPVLAQQGEGLQERGEPYRKSGYRGDSVLLVRLENVEVKANRHWTNDTLRYRYNQMRYYVTTILPYLKEATVLFHEIDGKLNEPGLTRKERKVFISSREELVRTRFEEKIKELNTTQGVLLMKLIARETGLNLYQMLTDFKNPVAAMKWQAWARINGFNLNRKYHPEEETQLESIMEGLGYPLPDFYNREQG